MADLGAPLDQLVVGQAQPAVTANELIDALSMAAFGGRRAATSSGLTWGYFGGRWGGTLIAHGTLSLTASQANIYIVVARASGTISFSTANTNWNDGTNYARLYRCVTSASAVTNYEDYRQITFA